MNPVNRMATFRGLKLYVKDLDSNTLPPFLARVCNPDKPLSFSEEEVLCIFETAAEAHGRITVPHISQIVLALTRMMSSASGSSHSHTVGCSNVVCKLSRYCIDPLAIEEEKSAIISSLCRPLSDCLMNTKESMSSGSAFCIRELVQSNNWQFTSNELVNDVCLKVSGALEEAQCQTASHLSLVVALSKQNPLTLEPYGRSLIRSGLQILDGSTNTSNTQLIISSIQMIHSIMKSLDLRIISSEISSIINAMEQFQDDCMPDISTAAFEAAETAEILGRRKECGQGKKLSPLTNYSGNRSRCRSHPLIDDVDIRDSDSSESPSCEVQSIHLFSQTSVGQCSGLPQSSHAKRRLWSNRSVKSHDMSAIPDCHALGVVGPSNSAGLVKSGRKFTDVPRSVADPCILCLTTQVANQSSQISRRQALSCDIRMQSTPRKQLHSCTFCSDSERDDRQLPESQTLRQIRRNSEQCTTGFLFEKNDEVEERKGYSDSIQHDNQCHVQNIDLLVQDLKFPISAVSSDSAGISPCEECQAGNEKIGGKRRYANCSGTPFFLFVCVVIIALLVAWWKEDCCELYAVPT